MEKALSMSQFFSAEDEKWEKQCESPLHCQTIVGEVDALGHTEGFLGMGGDVVAHVDDVGGLVANLTGKLYGLPNGLMGSVGTVAQSVDHKQPDTGKQFQGAGRNGGHVSNIGHVANAVSKDGQLAVHHLQGGYLGIVHHDGFIGLKIVQLKLWHAGILVFHQTIRQTLAQMGSGIGVGIDGQGTGVAERSKVVYAAHMVVMLVGDEKGIKRSPEIEAQHLLAEIGRAVYEYVGRSGLHQCRTAQALVPRIRAGTRRAVASQIRHSGAGTGSKKSDSVHESRG